MNAGVTAQRLSGCPLINLHTLIPDECMHHVQRSDDFDAPYGILARITTRVPHDQPTTSICILSTAEQEANTAGADVVEFVMHQKKGLPLPRVIAERHDIDTNHVPTRKDVAAAKERLKILTEQAVQLRYEVGKKRIDKYSRDVRDPAEEVQQLEAERDAIIEEYELKLEVEKERLSLIDQMHTGPEQTRARNKAKAQLNYLQNSLLDAKVVGA